MYVTAVFRRVLLLLSQILFEYQILAVLKGENVLSPGVFLCLTDSTFALFQKVMLVKN